MRVKFLKSVKGFAYFAGDVTTLPDEVANPLVESGMVTPFAGTGQNTLPAELPGRKLLFDAGLVTLEDIKSNLAVLGELPGMTKKLEDQINTYIHEYYTE